MREDPAREDAALVLEQGRLQTAGDLLGAVEAGVVGEGWGGWGWW